MLLGVILPAETALFLGAVLANLGRVSLPVLLGVAIVAAIAGGLIGYEWSPRRPS